MDYTSAVSIALDQAARWARQLGAREIQPLHLLLGLLDEAEGRAAVLLSRCGADVSSVRRALAPGSPPETSGHAGPLLEQGSATQELLGHAAELGRLLSAEGSVTSEQVLLACLRGDRSLRESLEKVGLRMAVLEREILREEETPLRLEEPLDLHGGAAAVEAARILDAVSNRAREGLRVLEDYCRFALDDAFLSREIKQMRHSLAEAVKLLPDQWLLEARNAPADVGRTITTPGELQRSDLTNVVTANVKRVQEALRSLEEYGKLESARFGAAMEALRYRTYTLESALLLSGQARRRLADARLCVLVSEGSCRLSLSGTIAEAAAGGAQIIQLREKGLDDRILLQRARHVRQATRKAGVLFIMNDRADIARLADADGVHVGQDDIPVWEARHVIGPDALIGVSTHTIAQVRQAVLDGASYIGVGPTFSSPTKRFESFPGLEFVRETCAETSLPTFAIGGITLGNINEVVAAGARRIAVGHAICQADDPRKAAAELRQALNG